MTRLTHVLTLLPLTCALAACSTATSTSAPSGAVATVAAVAASPADVARWRDEAARVTIVRDDWGIAHVHGHTDADAVFGMIYAQAEDDFNRVETNYVTSLGRTAEAEGESAIFQDLRQKLFIDPDTLKAQYAASPAWLKSLMDAWADGLNYYLYTHPQTTPRVITRFEPWMALSFTEGSIGGDIESISIPRLEAFYGGQGTGSAVGDAPGPPAPQGSTFAFVEPQGSNGFAIAPGNTRDHHALLWINPHTSFFFRSELQMSSDEGLDAYGAATWGQFFIYQGFNPRIGWMHTSTGADNIDEFAETISRDGSGFVYKYGSEERPVVQSRITVPYRTASGAMAARTFTVYRTHHGPIVREVDGKWIAVALMNRPIPALEQSYLRTKATDYASFRKIAELQANSSNNTIFADANGDIAYFHPQFVPRRNDRFDYRRPVDGSDPATDWRGLTPLDSLPQLLNPPNGWIQNTNDWPYSAAGQYSPKRESFPRYMDVAGESPRGLHAIRVLSGKTDFTPQSLIDAAFDSYLPAFAEMIPSLLRAYDSLPANDPQRAKLAEPVSVLRTWDDRWGVQSVPTAVAVFWGTEMWKLVPRDRPRSLEEDVQWLSTETTPAQRIAALAAAVDRLASDFGTWRTPWGNVNRFQRLTGDIVQPFNDAKPSIPVGFTSSLWGSIASFGARPYPGTRRWYGTNGNSFVAVVEFGDSVRARAVTAGGESGHPSSPHFDDEAERYATGNLRTVYFYPSQLTGHTERTYHPGE
jgi:acyl-homoserine-lactone acylase